MRGALRLGDIFIRRPWFAQSEAATREAIREAVSGLFKPGPLYAARDLGIHINWAQEYEKDRNWPASLHAWKVVDPLVYAARHASEASAATTRAVLLAVAWQRWHRKHKCQWSWYDWSVGLRSARLAWILQTFAQLEARHYPRIATLLKSMLHEHSHAVLSGRVPLKQTNHGLFQLHGLALLGRVSTDSTLKKHIMEFIGARIEAVINA